MHRGSFWGFQIAHADAELRADRITPRVAMDLFGLLLRDPQPSDWTIDPMESLRLVTPHSAVFKHRSSWREPNDHDAALEISDRVAGIGSMRCWPTAGGWRDCGGSSKRPTMPSTRPRSSSGRIFSQHPAYGTLSRQAKQIREQIVKMPLVAKDQEMARKQTQRFAEIAAVSANQDATIREMALRARRAGFPAAAEHQEHPESNPEGDGDAGLLQCRRRIYAFLLNQDKYASWTIKDPRLAGHRLQGLFREMGHYEANHELRPNDLSSTQWKQTARQLLDDLVAGSSADLEEIPEW